jgi:MFS family permease
MSGTRLPGAPIFQQTILVCALIGTAQMTWGVLVPVLPLYLDRYGLAVGLLGPIVAAFAVGRILANIPAGLALRRLPPRAYLWAVMLGLALVTALTGLASSAPALIAFRLVAGVFGGAAVTIGFAVLVAGAPAERRGRVMATATIVQMSAGAVGALLGGAVVGAVGPGWTFVVAAVPALACLGWDAVRPASTYWSAPTRPVATRGPSAYGKRSWLLIALCGLSFATFFVRFAGEQGLVPVLAYAGGGLRPFTLGLATAAGTVVSLAAMPVIGRWVDGGARISLLIPAGAGAAAALLALPVLHVPVGFSAAIVMYSLATSVIGVLPGVITGDAYPAAMAGGIIGLTRTAGDVGAAVGPLAVFGVAGVAGDEAACAVLAGIFVVSVAGLVVALPRRRRVIRGAVISGAGRGREMGFPTANLAVTDHRELPADGIYFGWFRLDGPGETHPALLSVGTNPTFGDGGRTAEAHVLDLDEDLYGRSAEVQIVTLIRRQARFDSVAALVAAMDRDKDVARGLIAGREREPLPW